MISSATTKSCAAGKGTQTPWGRAQYSRQYARGINFYGTAGHGGFRVSAGLQKRLHPSLSKFGGWFEEDCEWALVVLSFPEYFSGEEIGKARQTAKDWNPTEYQEITGDYVPVSESYTLRKQQSEEQNKAMFITKAAWGDWHPKVPRGMVGVRAIRAVGNVEKWFLVSAERYKIQSPVGYVVDQTVDQPWEDHA